MSLERINRDAEQDKPVPSPDLANNNLPQTPAEDTAKPFSAMGKSPQQLLNHVKQKMLRGEKLGFREMNWAFSHGGHYFHMQAGAYNYKIRQREEAERQKAEAGKNSVDSGEGITQILPQPDNQKQEEQKKRQAPNPFSAGNTPVDNLIPENEQQPEQEQQIAMLYGGGGGEEKKVLNVKGYLLKEFDISKAILGTLLGSYYDLIKKSSFWDVKAKISLESEFEKNVAKGEKIQFSKAYFPVEAQGRLDEHFYKVAASVFKGSAINSFTDPDNPAINFKLTGNLDVLSVALKGIEPEINIAKLEGKAAYTITRSNLDTGFPRISEILQQSWPAMYEGIMKGETNLKLVFSISLAFQLKEIAKLIKNALTQATKKATIEKHKEKINEQKTKERELNTDKKGKTAERNKLNDDISKKEKQLKKLDKATSETDLQKKAKLQEELAEKRSKLQKIHSEIDQTKDAIDESRKAQKTEKEAIKKAKEKFNKAKAENKKLTSAKKKGGKLTKAQRLNKYTDDILRKGGQLAEKIIKKTVNKTVEKIVRKAIITVVKMALRLIPVIGWLISAWDLITTLWDIGNAIWDWFTDDEKDKKEGSGGEGEGSDSETTDGAETNGQGTEGTGTGDGTGTGTGTGGGTGTGTTEGSGTGQAGTGGAEQTTNSGTNAPGEVKAEPAAPVSGNTTKVETPQKSQPNKLNIPVEKRENYEEGVPTAELTNLVWIAPEIMLGNSIVSDVKLTGYYNGEFFTTEPVFTFRYKNVNGKWSYYPITNYIFLINGTKIQVSVKYHVSKIEFQ